MDGDLTRLTPNTDLDNETEVFGQSMRERLGVLVPPIRGASPWYPLSSRRVVGEPFSITNAEIAGDDGSRCQRGGRRARGPLGHGRLTVGPGEPGPSPQRAA